MAVLLAPDAYDDWLDPDRTRGQGDILDRPYDRDGELEYFPISRLVNNPANDAPDCLEPAAAEEIERVASLAKRANAQMRLDL
jgi:putative SOS response-associated peptidase YedK